MPLRLAVNNVPKRQKVTSERRYENTYAGMWPGFCKTRESALLAACRHLVTDGYTSATVTDRHTGETVARVRLSADRKRASIEVVKPLKKVS